MTRGRNTVKRKSTPPLAAFKKGRTSPPSPTQLDNQHSDTHLPPSEDEENSDRGSISSSNLDSNTNSSPPPSPKVPPIFLPGSAWRQVASKLMTAVPTEGITAKVCDNNTIKLHCVDHELFRIVQKYLHKNNVDFHTVPSSTERSIKVVIRGLLPEISETEVYDELKCKGYDVTTVRQFGNATRKFPLHMVILPASPSSKLIYNETSLFYMAIKIEAYKSNHPAQCFSCQRFGHSSLHCGYAPRCVKCASGHLAKDCLKTREDPPTCVNCGGDHTANFKSCPSLILEKEKRRPDRPNTSKTAFNTSTPPLSNCPVPAAPINQLSNTQNAPSITTTYASKTSSNSLSNATVTDSIVSQLTTIVTNLASNNMKVKDALISLLTILPQLLNLQNE